MRRLLRPSSVMMFLAAVVVAAVVWVYKSTSLPARPVPLPVEDGDCEIAWLYPATATVNWQRFVQAVDEIDGKKDRPEAFPRLTTAVPEVGVQLPGGGQLRFRWYKITNEWKTDYWMQALAQRHPPPLAVIGGNNTDTAADQARRLRRAAADLPERLRPLLLLTTATADKVPPEEHSRATDPQVPLVALYGGRTFRFCFSNRQMGEAVSHFIWSKKELRPDSFPAYLAVWQDDAYSSDLVDGFANALQPYHFRAAVTAAAGDWGMLIGSGALRGFPLGALATEVVRERQLPFTAYIPWSVGGFDRPNRYEAEWARDILDKLEKQGQQRPLLVLSGQSQPSRRLVRALSRLEPIRARRFVMATGDAIPFNTVYRDRNVTWPIQDLPSTLVFFCHCNPIAVPAQTPTSGSTASSASSAPSAERDSLNGGGSASGTEDLLLYKEIVQALALANSTGPCADADELRDRLRRLHLDGDQLGLGPGGSPLFDEHGNRRSGTGEHVVWLQPRFEGERSLPEATIRVYYWHPGNAWALRGKKLRVLYTGGT
jgi:hypothetical protein